MAPASERPSSESPGTGAAEPPAVRASTRERESVVQALHTAVAEGRLPLEEADERMATAYGARFRHELVPLQADLPDPGAEAGVGGGWAGLWAGAVTQARVSCLGPGAAGTGPPTSRQSAVAAIVLAAAFVWLALWVLAGFALGALG